MNKEIRKWWSPSLGRDMRMIQYGDGGTPVIAFPGDGGNAEDWENHGILAALEVQMSEGYNTIFCLDSVDSESLLNKNVDPNVRIMRQKQYESYITDEVFPLIRELSTHHFVIAAGIHLGGYQALNLALRYPHRINKAISVMGAFDIKPYLDGFYDDTVYFMNPVDFLPNLNDSKILDDIRKIDLRLCTSPKSKNHEANLKISSFMHNKSLTHELDMDSEADDANWEHWSKIILRHIP